MEKYKIENLQKDSIKELKFDTLNDQQSAIVLKNLFQGNINL